LTRFLNHKNIPKILNIMRKILEMDWDMNPNKLFRARENIYKSLKIDLALQKWYKYKNIW
jgi:hypothetical protein